MKSKSYDDTEDGLPDNQVDLADLCSALWDKYFLIGASHPDANNIATKYNIAANAYNRNAGARMMTALTPSTENPQIAPEDSDIVAARPLAEASKRTPPVIAAAHKEKDPSDAPVKLYGQNYLCTTDPMPLTPEIDAIVKGEGSGADKIRAVYMLNPAGFNIADFEKYTGINKGRIKGCLQKMKVDD